MDAIKNNSNKLVNSRLYFIRLNEKEEPSIAGPPYCTICSKMALDVGIKEFVLWHEKGAYVYDTKEYNSISFQFGINFFIRSSKSSFISGRTMKFRRINKF